jgi:uncharacterized protein YbgA (DUF1722 family)
VHGQLIGFTAMCEHSHFSRVLVYRCTYWHPIPRITAPALPLVAAMIGVRSHVRRVPNDYLEGDNELR